MSRYLNPHRSPNGSLLIWSVLLGFILTSVFFFSGMRQRAMVDEQRDTADILNAKAYMESYADYLQKNKSEINAVEFDGMKTTLTQKTDAIEGWVDSGSPVQYNFGESKSIFLEWNKCADNNKSDLAVNGAVYLHDNTPGNCSGYDDIAGPIEAAALKIETLSAPAFYKISGTDLKDNLWRLEISKDMGYGKVITVKRMF